MGPWKDGKPVGDWWEDHDSAASARSRSGSPAAVMHAARSNPPRKRNVSQKKDKQQTTTKRVKTTAKKPAAAVIPERLVARESSSHVVEQPQQSTNLTNEAREKLIARWLDSVIGYNPDKEETRAYAKEFIALGLHSAQMIIDLLPAERVETFNDADEGISSAPVCGKCKRKRSENIAMHI